MHTYSAWKGSGGSTYESKCPSMSNFECVEVLWQWNMITCKSVSNSTKDGLSRIWSLKNVHEVLKVPRY